MPSFVIEYQLILILTSFALGAAGAIAAYCSPAASFSWRAADLIWVLLGGLGALAAIFAGLYQDERASLARRIDLTYALSRGFESDAARFRLAHCETDRQGPAYRAAVLTLCDRIEFLSASASENRGLPLFLEIAAAPPRLRTLEAVLGGGGGMAADERRALAEAFRSDTLLAFSARNEATAAALPVLEAEGGPREIAADYRVLAASYEELIGETGRLIEEWAYLQENSRALTVQVLALCLIAFAAPFRIGKSLADFR
jgi:hypothetical protein